MPQGTCRRCGAPIFQANGCIRVWCLDCLAAVPMRSCATCDEPFQPRGPHGKSFTYCVRCVVEHRSDKVRLCATCGKLVGKGQSKFCSLTCRVGEQHKLVTCMVCGAAFTRNATRTSMCCSPRCTLEARRERYRRKNRARRTKRAPGAYTLAEVAERDRHRCHLCGKKVNMSLSGMHPRGPTIDHLVPLSADGDDVLANVALAHRACNIRKGANGPPQQLRLIG